MPGVATKPAKTIDPLRLIKDLWPKYKLSREQRMLVTSVFLNKETIAPAGNQLGKDFISALIVLVFFITRRPCRIVLTSANDKHLNVLWSEIKRHIQNCRVPLTQEDGGPLYVTEERITRVDENGKEDAISYIVRMVCSDQTVDSMAGHHAYPDSVEEAALDEPLSLAVTDEASSIRDIVFDRLKSWATRLLVIGNPYPCDNYFKHAVKGKPGTEDKGGDRPRPNGVGFLRKIIRIRAIDSPNIRYAMAQLAAGMKETDEGFAPIIVPGLRDYWTYKDKLGALDKILRTVQLDGDFYEGSELKLWAPDWLAHCALIAQRQRLKGFKNRIAKALGIDTAEGGDKTAFVVGDEFGILDAISLKTPDTSIIPGMIKAYGRQWKVPPSNWILDRGGGGKQHADALRAQGFAVRTVAFNEAASSAPPKGDPRSVKQRFEAYEDTHGVYKNRRAEMYGEFSAVCDPSGRGYGIPLWLDACKELHRQLGLIPRLYNEDGEMYMLPKSRKSADAKTNQKTLTELLGCSPDEADAAVLMYWGVKNQVRMAFGVTPGVPQRVELIPR